MFYIKAGAVNVTGGDIFLSPPDSGPYEGIQFFQARDNSNAAFFRGNGVLTGYNGDNASGTGTMYFPNALFELAGRNNQYVSRIIADTVEIAGTASKVITRKYPVYVGGNNVYLAE